MVVLISVFSVLAIFRFRFDLMFNIKYLAWQDFLFNKMKTGRPTIQNTEKKAKITGVRLRDEERTLVELAASHKKQKLSVWMRNVLVSSATEELHRFRPS